MSEQQPQEPVASVEQTAAPVSVAPVSTAAGSKIDAWFARSFSDSPVSRDTAIYNYVRTAVDALKKELAT